jgi:nucleotide-binding universal stress UspA family protein
MSNGYKTILFTSNLSKTSRIAFQQAALLANQFNAKLILLHIMEGPSGNYESFVSNLFSENEWQKILRKNRDEAKHALVGKVTPKQMARTALSAFCKEGAEVDENYEIPNYEIIVKEGEVIETILKQAKESNCDLIVLGSSEGLLSGLSVGKNIKSVLKKSKIPVLVVPSKTA